MQYESKCRSRDLSISSFRVKVAISKQTTGYLRTSQQGGAFFLPLL